MPGPSALIINSGSSLDEETAAVSYTHDHRWRSLEGGFTVLFVSIVTAACQILADASRVLKSHSGPNLNNKKLARAR